VRAKSAAAERAEKQSESINRMRAKKEERRNRVKAEKQSESGETE
jgi:hypothetical protein